MERPLFIPVILGTARQGRQSEHVARFVFERTKKHVDVETELIDVRDLPMRVLVPLLFAEVNLFLGNNHSSIGGPKQWP